MTRRHSFARRTHGRALPRLETLENRVTPAVTTLFDQASGALLIRGDAQASNVSIVADGDSFMVTGTNQDGDFTAVRSIEVDLGGGADTFNLDLSAADSLGMRVSA